MNMNQVPRGRFLINKCESTLDALINMNQVPRGCFFQQVESTLDALVISIQVPRGSFLINESESTLDALINMNQVPRCRFLINKCENNSKYIDKEYPGPKRLFSYQQVCKQL